MNIGEIIIPFIALGSLIVALLAYFRIVLIEVPSADLFFEQDGTGEPFATLVFDNPTRRSLLLKSVRISDPDRNNVTICRAREDLKGTTHRAYEQAQSGDKSSFAVFLRVPPKGSAKLRVDFRKETTGLDCEFEWSQQPHWLLRWRIPRRVNYSADDIKAMRIAAEPGEA